MDNTKYELLIEHGGGLMAPAVLDGVKWTTKRFGTPGKLEFSVVKDAGLDFTEGDAVRFRDADGCEVFYGFVFRKGRSAAAEKGIQVTAYDQLRYLKNKDTIQYKGKTAGELLGMLARDYQLNLGTVEDTGYIIGLRTEENKTLYDILGNALDLTLDNTGNLFILYDDFGKISLRNLSSMVTNVIIDETAAQDYTCETSIDEDTYNQVKLVYANEDTGKWDTYLAKDSGHIAQWGVLQYFDTLKEGEAGAAKAMTILELYNAKTRKLKVTKAWGVSDVRAGCLVAVRLNVGDEILNHLMLVESCTHTYAADEHWMDLTLTGGGYSA